VTTTETVGQTPSPQGRRATGVKPMSAAELARYYYDRNPDDPEEAIEEYSEAIAKRPDLMYEAAVLYGRSLIKSYIPLRDNKEIRQGKDPKQGLPPRPPGTAHPDFMKHQAASILALGEQTRDLLYDITYGIDGTRVRLGDLTGAQIDIVVSEKRGRISSEYRDMKFLQLLRDRVPDNKTVAECLDVNAAQQLRAQADELPV